MTSNNQDYAPHSPHHKVNHPSTHRSTPRSTHGLRPVVGLAHKIIKPLIRQRGTALATLSLDWPDIVGAYLATTLYPDKLTFPRHKAQDQDTASPQKIKGHLRLRVLDSFAHEVPYIKDQLIAKINTFFGYEVVAAVSLRQVHALTSPGPANPSATFPHSSPASYHPSDPTASPSGGMSKARLVRTSSALDVEAKAALTLSLSDITHEPLRAALAEMAILLHQQ